MSIARELIILIIMATYIMINFISGHKIIQPLRISAAVFKSNTPFNDKTQIAEYGLHTDVYSFYYKLNSNLV